MWKRQRQTSAFEELREGAGAIMSLEDFYRGQNAHPPPSAAAHSGDSAEDFTHNNAHAHDEAEEDEEESQFEPVGLESRAAEREQLGEPAQRRTCFGCVYVGERESGAIQKESLVEIMDMITKSIGQVDLIVLAEEVARKYEFIRRETNESLLPGERELPPWSAATILDHFRFHHCTPTFKLWFALNEIREYKEIAGHSMVERDKKTGKKRINKDGIKSYEMLTKLEWQLAKIDPTKCTFHNGDSHLDLKSVSQGPINTSFKPVVEMFRRAKH